MPYMIVPEGDIYYEIAGAGPLLLIFPGNTSGAVHHAGEMAHFGDRFTVASFDYIGYGRSTRIHPLPDDFYARNARHGAALARRLRVPNLIVMGTSGGGIAALWMAILYPEMVLAVIADSTPAEFPLELAEMVLAERDDAWPPQVAFWTAAHGEDWKTVVDADTELVRRLAAAHGADLFAGRLGEIHCPVLVTASSADAAIGAPGLSLATLVHAISGAKGVLFHGGGHPTIWSQPERFRRVAGRFLTDVVWGAGEESE